MRRTGLLLVICLLWPSAGRADDSSAAPMDTYNKAITFFQAGRWNAAREYLHQYLAEYSDTPLYVTCLYDLAYCYQQLKDRPQAVLLYHKVIDQAQGDDAFWADMAQKRLEEMENP